MAWIESHQELGAHPKTQKLARILGLSKPTVIGHLHFLWWWATDYAPDGDLSRFDSLDIAIGAEWEGDEQAFVDALVRAGFLDQTDTALVIHDWREYAGRLIEQRELRASRARRNRGLYNDDELIRIVRTRDGDSCRYCGRTVNWKDRKGAEGGTYDHIDPDAVPENTPENVVVACRACNAAKGKRTPEEAGMVLLFPAGNPKGTAETLPSSAVNQPTNLTEQNKTETEGANAPARAHGKAYPPGFLQFWAAYPRKQGKDDAFRAWKQIRPTEDDLNEMVEALRKQRQSIEWCEEGGRFIPHPGTWLRAGRWKDEGIEVLARPADTRRGVPA